jgi:hypothetical protein
VNPTPDADPRLGLFAMPKPFRGHIGLIQRNAVRSWARLTPRPEILLLGDEAGTADVAREFGVLHEPNVRRNEHGAPLLDGLFRAASRRLSHELLVFINGDILLQDDFTAAVRRVVGATPGAFLMVGRRTDADVATELDLDTPAGREALRTAVARGSLAPRVCKDYFVFRRSLFTQVPPFAIGRGHYDNWLVARARDVGATVIDATAVVEAVHQNHGYAHIAGGRGRAYVHGDDARRNQALGGGMRLVRGSTTDFILTPTALRRRRIPSDLVQFAADLPKFLLLVAELYGLRRPRRPADAPP